MIGRLIRRVRDTFAAGAAERRFRELESQTRSILEEIDHALNKWAIAKATDARRKTRALAKETDPGRTMPDQVFTGPEARAAWKAQTLRNLRAGVRSSAVPVEVEPQPEPEEESE